MIENMILRILSAFLVASSVGSAQPNIIILYSDDAGYADFGFQPNCAADMKKLTPNIIVSQRKVQGLQMLIWRVRCARPPAQV